ncbi:Oligopeptide transport ATP-binding protein OppD [Devosia sp. LC5]|uniref:ABC transporter ATP-binding protein n=1 Tax=Devosia sp. LC5 TaxID=1502724 RepID=UPI0004E34125|nr:ABC transporter ATP-binding protein [Devosia sp. LC5]KFC67191.1 Oligopeptide transport ATP-binding protein OppD [Devosia sp. LC5]
MSLVEVDNLNVWIGERAVWELHAVRDVSFQLDKGERLVVVGESGCGKSTTLLSLLGLLPAAATVTGRVVIDGVDIFDCPEEQLAALRWKDAAMVFQASSNPLNPVRTLAHQLRAVLRFHGTPRGKVGARIATLLDMVRLPQACANYYPHQLSGGMRQRAVIALALACDPKLLLADEATTALDPLVQAEIIELLVSLCKSLDLALVLVTHELQLVSAVEGNLAVMYAGEIVEYGPANQLMATPRHPYLQRLVATLPRLDSPVAPVSIPGVPPRLDTPLVGCPFAPRCTQAVDICRSTPPRLEQQADGRLCACHFAGTGLAA